ncbi:MAG: hypothetical protein AB9844_08050 [Clostridiaceae bacterium]
MKIREIKELLGSEPITCVDCLHEEVVYGFASDLMSDVLALNSSNNVLLITGLMNLQTIRTAEMKDIKYIVFVRGKVPDEGIIQLARENGLCIICTKETMFRTCGILFSNGLQGAKINK